MLIPLLRPLRTAATLVLLLSLPGLLSASPEAPEKAEVMDIYAAMVFRNAMIADPAAVARETGNPTARKAIEAINDALTEWGSGPADGWRYFMSTATYAATGVGDQLSFVMFYNPWVDTALITRWRDASNGIILADLEWMPGDHLRGQEIDLDPAWLRPNAHPSAHPSLAMINTLADTVDAFESRFGDPGFATGWRKGLGLDDRAAVAELLSPLIAVRILDTQMRLTALEYVVDGEDPLLNPMREAMVELIRTARTDGFAPLLAKATGTPPDLAPIIAAIQPDALPGLAPVAYIADDDEVLMYFATPLTSDFVLSATYARGAAGLDLRVLDFIPYASSYEALRAKQP